MKITKTKVARDSKGQIMWVRGRMEGRRGYAVRSH
jgi:hypothetical protein